MNVKPHHPLQELLAQLLFGIETVPVAERKRMVNFACKEAAKWHNRWIKKMKFWIKEMMADMQLEYCRCPECGNNLDYMGHKDDCELAIMLKGMDN